MLEVPQTAYVYYMPFVAGYSAMANTGAITPATVSDVGGGSLPTAWVDPNNSKVEDGSLATYALPVGGGRTGKLRFSDFGFAITGTVVGVVVEVKSKNSAPLHDTYTYAQLVKAGTPGGTDSFVFMTPRGTLTWFTLGTSTDMWGNTLLFSDINNSGFGIDVWTSTFAPAAASTSSIDSVRVTVYFTPRPSSQGFIIAP